MGKRVISFSLMKVALFTPDLLQFAPELYYPFLEQKPMICHKCFESFIQMPRLKEHLLAHVNGTLVEQTEEDVAGLEGAEEGGSAEEELETQDREGELQQQLEEEIREQEQEEHQEEEAEQEEPAPRPRGRKKRSNA